MQLEKRWFEATWEFGFGLHGQKRRTLFWMCLLYKYIWPVRGWKRKVCVIHYIECEQSTTCGAYIESTCFKRLTAYANWSTQIYAHVPYHYTGHLFHVHVFVSQTANSSQCSFSALRSSHPSPTVTRWLSVGACQGLCGFHKALRRFPFPGALGAPVCLASARP